MNRIALFLICAFCVASAVAQEPLLGAELEQEARRYTVEIIIFSYEENVAVGNELFVRDKASVTDDRLADEIRRGDEPGTSAKSDETVSRAKERAESHFREIELVMLDQKELTLDKAARQFALLDVYETIMHFGWTQAAYPKEETPPIELRVLGRRPAGLDGTLTLYLSRYLHLVVDLALDAPVKAGEKVYGDQPDYSFGDSRAPQHDDFDRTAQALRFRIQENRILKNGELRYFDHPKFGVLAKVTRVDDPDEDEQLDEDEESEPLLSRVRQ